MKGLKTIKRITGTLLNRLPELYAFQYLYLTVLLVFVLSLQSCYYDVIITGEQSQTTKISLRDNVLPVFSAACITCHNGVTALPDLTSEHAYNSLISGNYIDITTPENSVLIKKVRSGHPYAGALTVKEVGQIIQWIEEGALEN